MNMRVVNGQLYSRSTGARSTTLVPVLQKVYLVNYIQTAREPFLTVPGWPGDCPDILAHPYS